MNSSTLGLLLAITVLLTVGLFFVLHLGLGSLRRLRAWEARATRTSALVVRHESRTYKGNTYHFPVVRFSTPAGVEIVFEAQRASRKPDPPVGGSLEVLYDPEAPTAARLPGQDRAGAFLMAGVGTVFLLVGTVMAGVVLGR